MLQKSKGASNKRSMPHVKKSLEQPRHFAQTFSILRVAAEK
jgi:hypothetical protein